MMEVLPVFACISPEGYLTNGDDCDDNDELNPEFS